MERDIVKRIEDLMDLFDEGEVTTADEIERPEDPFRDFMDRNPLAGGGMLVQPGFGGTRQGYKEEARFKKEGLETRISNKVRDLIGKIEPINPKTGKVYTMKEYASLTRGQKDKLSARLRGKFKSKFRAPRLGYYPEKDANKLINFLKIAADKQKKNKIPLKERTFISVIDDGKFVGVRDVKANTLYTHIDYKGKRKGTSIAQHPSQDEVLEYLKQAKKFKFEKPEKLLGSYFSQYERVPTYSEIYNFFNRDRNAPIKSFQQNALEIHHRGLIEKMPDAKFQLVTMRKNTEANRILNLFNNKQITKQQADTALKKLGVNLEGMGKKDITTGKSIASAKRETVKLFKDALTKNPKLIEDITKKLNIPKGERGFIEKALLRDIGKVAGRGVRTVSKYFGVPDAIFATVDYLNERSKGKSKEEAKGIAINNATFGLYGDPQNKAYIQGLQKTAESMGIDSSAFNSAYQLNILNKDFEKFYTKGTEQIKNLKELGLNDQAKNAQINLDRYADEQNKKYMMLQNDISDRITGGSPLTMLQGRGKVTQEQFEKPFFDMQDVALEKLKREKQSVFPTIQRKVNPAEGSMGTGFYNILDQIGQGIKNIATGRVVPFGPERLRPQASQRQLLADELRNLSARDLQRFNLGRGLTYGQPLTADDIENLQFQQPGVFFSKGGIAGLSGGDKSGPPPERGPNSQGLPSLLKRVRNI